MSKEMWIEAHMELVDERMAAWEESHPDATKAEYDAEQDRAYDQEADRANDRYADKLGDMADRLKDRMKEEGTWGR